MPQWLCSSMNFLEKSLKFQNFTQTLLMYNDLLIMFGPFIKPNVRLFCLNDLFPNIFY
jgi:hypothetical protein